MLKKIKSFLAFLLSDVVFIMFINVKMPTSQVKHSTTELPTRVVLLCPCSYRYLEKWPSTHFWGSSFEPCYIENNAMLTHLRPMEFPTIINWTGPFPGLWGGIFHFYSNFKRAFCKQTVETQNVASDLGLYCLRTSHKKEARVIWLKPKKCEPNRTAFEMEVL